MFTGIVEEIGIVVSATGKSLNISAREVLKGLTLGQSMAVNGVCHPPADYAIAHDGNFRFPHGWIVPATPLGCTG